MTWWDHFLADAVPTAVMSVIAAAALGTSHLVAFLTGVRWERRRRWRAVADQRAGFLAQSQITVPLLAASMPEADR
ncbi:hypothetical protein FHR83_006634 [Actinoplanes campanulatus]|uniref:Uncharacterized protein n=1 Tax=Actinoplanes campanulatus TaxID=113559 RepID=A0A7W5AMC7_9ACTN|nr:hypothetical protein [Actinoplanes campanulatus]MBB3098928.1 hypothetical protein [Actinoplanes campanulatus]GGN39814.1 hypothetical protein GCM10010109_68220 [Actinoplanes campanulatus]GID40132.1 hypothetical protein Aca09nite_66380 [Actinoplanes campanulatus]